MRDRRNTVARRLTGIACLLVAAAAAGLVVVVFGPSGERQTAAVAPARESGGGSANTIRVTLSPAVVLRGQQSTITVTGIDGPAPQVQLVGATFGLGHPLPWKNLSRTPDGWRAKLPPPEFRGVYRIRLRTSTGARVQSSADWFLRVYAKGTLTRPLLETPEDVAEAWVDAVSTNAKLTAIRRWPLPAFDHRDPELHQVLVVAYTVEGHRRVEERLGIFVTAVREDNTGRWRLLEATAAPQ